MSDESAPTVLVVDDNPPNTKLMTALLSVKGYEVRVAESGKQALEMLAQAVPDLILVDIQMPEMDGLELTRRIRADAHTRDAIVVAVTAYAMRGDEERALAAGCDAYVTKPIDTRALPGLLASLLGRRRGGGGA